MSEPVRKTPTGSNSFEDPLVARKQQPGEGFDDPIIANKQQPGVEVGTPVFNKKPVIKPVIKTPPPPTLPGAEKP